MTLVKLAILVLTLASSNPDPVIKQQAILQATNALNYAQTIINEQPVKSIAPTEPDTREWADDTHSCWYEPTMIYTVGGGSYMGKGKVCGG